MPIISPASFRVGLEGRKRDLRTLEQNKGRGGGRARLSIPWLPPVTRSLLGALRGCMPSLRVNPPDSAPHSRGHGTGNEPTPKRQSLRMRGAEFLTGDASWLSHTLRLLQPALGHCNTSCRSLPGRPKCKSIWISMRRTSTPVTGSTNSPRVLSFYMCSRKRFSLLSNATRTIQQHPESDRLQFLRIAACADLENHAGAYRHTSRFVDKNKRASRTVLGVGITQERRGRAQLDASNLINANFLGVLVAMKRVDI